MPSWSGRLLRFSSVSASFSFGTPMRRAHGSSQLAIDSGWFALTLVMLALLPRSVCAQWWREVSTTNGSMDQFSSGVAVGWSAKEAHSAGSPGFAFLADSTNYEDAPYAQGVSNLELFTEPGAFAFVGVCQRVTGLVAGKVYLYTGYQDIYTSAFQQPLGRRYVHKFGISTANDDTVGNPAPDVNPGNAKWMPQSQQFWNNMAGNSTQIGGFHHCMSAWTAESDAVVLWSGVTVDASGTPDPYATKLDVDRNQLFEFDNSPRASLQNGSFETVVDLTPTVPQGSFHKIIVPEYWVPAGGGIGQYETYLTDSTGAHVAGSGKGARIFNRRGCLTRGLMQRIQVPTPGATVQFACWAAPSGADGTRAEIGVDPTGGADINAPQIVWDSNASVTGEWLYLVASASCGADPVVTLFLRSTNQAGATPGYHWSAFDDAAVAFVTDATPPTDFSVFDDGSATSLVHYLHATIAPMPQDPESGIRSIECGVGSAPGLTDVSSYRTLTEGQSDIELTGLSLQNARTYYVTVKATSNSGQFTLRSSDGITVNAWSYPSAYTWQGPEHLSSSAYNCDSPRMAVASDGGLHAVWRESDGPTWDGASSRIVYRKRGGTRWLCTTQASASARCFLPDVTEEGLGRVFVACLVRGDGGDRLAVSVRDGSSGFRETLLSGSFSARVELAPLDGAIVVGANQCRSVAFPNRCDAAHTFSQWLPTGLLYTDIARWDMSPPGVEWTGWETLLDGGDPCDSDPYDGSPFTVQSGGDISCASPSLFVDDDGQLHAVYYGESPQGSNNVEMWYARAVSLEWIQASKVVTGAADARVVFAPGSGIHVFYSQNGGIWYTWSADGQSWGRRVYLAAGRWPEAAVGPDGRVHVLFLQPTETQNYNGAPLYQPTHMFLEGGRWCVPKAICPPSATSGHTLERPGDLVVGTNGDLHFVWANNPNDLGWQGDVFRGFYWVDYWTTGPANPYHGTIAEAKAWGDDGPAIEMGLPPTKTVVIENALVTAVGAFKHYRASPPGWICVPCFYVQDDSRTSGIRVVAGPAGDCPANLAELPTPGQRVQVSGAPATVDGERCIGYPDVEAHWQVQIGVAGAPSPIFMSTRALGGGPLGPTPGVEGGVGLNNVGLLVRVAGRVTGVSIDEASQPVFFVDDGSSAPGLGPIRVRNPGVGVSPGQFVIITGPSVIDLRDSTPGNPGDEIYAPTVMPGGVGDVAIVGNGNE